MVSQTHTIETVRALLVQRKLLQGGVEDATVQLSTELVVSNGDPEIRSQISSSKQDEKYFNILRDSILASLNLIPVVGGALSYLGALFIPSAGESQQQMWSRLIDEKVSAALMKKVERDLIGLSNVARLYKEAVESGNNQTILAQSIAANTTFTALLPGFQLRGEESALLPLFAIAVTLHLALQRDMALKGKDIGFTDDHVKKIASDMNRQIEEHIKYVDKFVAAAIDKTRRDNPYSNVGPGQNMPLLAMLETKTNYQISVIDFRDTWAGFNPIRFPGPSRIKLDREVYTRIVGWWRDGLPPTKIPQWLPPPSPLLSLKAWEKRQWSTQWIFGFESGYTGQRIKSGSQTGTVRDVPIGRYIEEVITHWGVGVRYMSFRSDGRWTNVGVADPKPYRQSFRSAFPGHRLSSIRTVGVGRPNDAAEGAVSGCVFGFQLINQEASSISLSAFDVIAPKIAPQLLKWIAEV